MNPALFKRLVALGFEPGSMNPEAWAVSQLEIQQGSNEDQATYGDGAGVGFMLGVIAMYVVENLARHWL